MGMRSISLVVDITNYVMLELGQPLHAFDKSKIKGGLTIKRAGKAQPFTTLDGQVRQLHPDDLMVCDDEQPLALAGTMGGASSEISESTTEIALEAVRFDPVCIAKNSRRHKLSSEASRRLERSVDPSLAEFASARFVQLLTQNSSAQHVATVVDGKPKYAPLLTLDHDWLRCHSFRSSAASSPRFTYANAETSSCGCDNAGISWFGRGSNFPIYQSRDY
jgi:phenylalanyl-tRNA synthetase beta chain